MEEIVTLIDISGNLQISAKKELGTVIDISSGKINLYLALKDQNLAKYLHNTKGPAIKLITPKLDSQGNPVDYREYWVNGVRLEQKEGEKMEHTADFNNRAEEILFSDK